MSHQYVYEQKNKVLNYTGTLDNNEDLSVKTIILSDDIIKKTIISLLLDCASSYEGVQNFFESIFKMKISKATISNVINEASKRARKFDDSVDLSEISQGANDEIFQCNKPILTGIDLKSTYIYLLEDANNRTGETWQIYMEDRKENNLDLCVSVNDGGTGLIAGVKEAFPEIEIQYDVFHYLRSLGREVQKFERKAYSLIDKEAKLEKSMNTAHPHKKTKEKYQ